MILSLIIPWLLFVSDGHNVSSILKDFAIINITIAIGLIAATIGIEESSEKDSMMYLALSQIAIGVISYFLGLLGVELLSTLYLSLNGVSIGSALAKYLRHYEKK